MVQTAPNPNHAGPCPLTTEAAPSAPVRVQLSRAKGWRMPADTVKVDRSTRWGNPFNLKSADYCWTALAVGFRADLAGRQAASVELFRRWINAGVAAGVADCGLYLAAEGEPPVTLARSPSIVAGVPPTVPEIRSALGGKNLACWCKPGAPCHADVLLELANAPLGNTDAVMTAEEPFCAPDVSDEVPGMNP